MKGFYIIASISIVLVIYYTFRTLRLHYNDFSISITNTSRLALFSLIAAAFLGLAYAFHFRIFAWFGLVVAVLSVIIDSYSLGRRFASFYIMRDSNQIADILFSNNRIILDIIPAFLVFAFSVVLVSANLGFLLGSEILMKGGIH